VADPSLVPAKLEPAGLAQYISAAYPRVRAAPPETLSLHLSCLKHFNRMVAGDTATRCAD